MEQPTNTNVETPVSDPIEEQIGEVEKKLGLELEPMQVVATVAGVPVDQEMAAYELCKKYAAIAANSGMVGESFKKNEDACFVAIMMGREVGLSPFQALQNIDIVGRKPAIWGDALPAIVRSSGQLEWIKEDFDADMNVATCTVKRKGEAEKSRTFSWDDAVVAGLADKKTYRQYPRRMLQVRARAWVFRDVFPDILKGLGVVEELEDYAEEVITKPPKEKRTIKKPEMTGEAVIKVISEATTMKELLNVKGHADRLPEGDGKQQAREAYAAKRDELKKEKT